MQQIYRFRVGVRNLSGSGSSGSGKSTGSSLGSSSFNHACFLINKDLFEYGTGDNQNYIRRKNVGRDPSFNWDELGEALNGTTKVSPDELEKKIMNSNQWYGKLNKKGNDYKALEHNCHDFVQFCLGAVGCHAKMIKKGLFVYRKQ